MDSPSIHPALDDTSFKKKPRNPLVHWVCGAYTVQINRYKLFMKPGAPPLQSTRLLDQVRERIRYLHYSPKTEKAYLYCIRFFTRLRLQVNDSDGFAADSNLL